MDLYIVFVSFEKDIWILFFSQLMRKSYSKTQTTETSQQREKKKKDYSNRNYYYHTRACFCRARVFRARVYMITFAKLCNHKYFSILLFFFVVFEKNFLSTALFVFLPLALENGRRWSVEIAA